MQWDKRISHSEVFVEVLMPFSEKSDADRVLANLHREPQGLYLSRYDI